MTEQSSPRGGDGEKKNGGFNSLRSIWQERVKEGEGPAAPKFPRPSGGRTSSGGNAPPPSPSSRANVLLSQPQDTVTDPFQQYGISFVGDNAGVLTIKKVTPGSAADQAGVIFPGDALHEVNGMEVHKWPLERVMPLASGDRAGATLGVRGREVRQNENLLICQAASALAVPILFVHDCCSPILD